MTKSKAVPTSTVGRARSVTAPLAGHGDRWDDDLSHIRLGDALSAYADWPAPQAIISDGAYGVLGFEGDTSDHLELPEWYEPHIRAWAIHSKPSTTLWFWNSEIGWAAVHPILERHGWRYVNANIWDKGKAHIAGNVNTSAIRRFPVVTEICVQYVRVPKINGLELKEWLLAEWKRTGLRLREANLACGVADAAVRKYLDQGHLWYFPPPDKFERLVAYANEKGDPRGRPYFSADGRGPMTGSEWTAMRSIFRCPHGVTNVWSRGPLHGEERVTSGTGKAVHLNQKPLDLMRRIIEATTNPGDVVWEPFGGLFSGVIACRQLGRIGYGAELDRTYYSYGESRLATVREQIRLL